MSDYDKKDDIKDLINELLIKGGIIIFLICGCGRYLFKGPLREIIGVIAVIGLFAFVVGVIWLLLATGIFIIQKLRKMRKK